MLPEWVFLVPPWLLAGLALGVVVSVLVAGVFLVGGRLFPGPDPSFERGPRIDGTARRRDEIRDYLRDVGEPYAEDVRVHGRRVAFYLPARDVAITFDAQAYFHIRRAGTYAVLCEHEMPGRHLGRRLPFEVPERPHTPPAADDPIRASFALLDLPSTASAREVTAAYRDRVKAAHPDHGGDRETFRRLREAYTTAKDHAERAPTP